MNADDRALLDRLRAAAEAVDPAPTDLADRVIAALAVADISREYALLTLVEGAEAAVRHDAQTTTLQFSDGASGVLLHVSRTASGRRRIDGWIDADAAEVRLLQGERTTTTAPDDDGRFVFDEVRAGLSRVQLVTPPGAKDLITPQFEA